MTMPLRAVLFLDRVASYFGLRVLYVSPPVNRGIMSVDGNILAAVLGLHRRHKIYAVRMTFDDQVEIAVKGPFLPDPTSGQPPHVKLVLQSDVTSPFLRGWWEHAPESVWETAVPNPHYLRAQI